MYDDDDILRSLRRYYAAVLGDNPEGRWEWRLSREEVADDARPVAVIELGDVRAVAPRSSITQGNVTELAPYTVTLYPPLVSAQGGPIIARRLAAELRRIIVTGVDLGTYTVFGKQRPVAGPMRIPLWDYTDVPFTGPGQAGPVAPHDHLWVEDVSARAIQDPLDALRWSVVSDVRISWERPGRVGPVAPVVTSMPGAFGGTVRPGA